MKTPNTKLPRASAFLIALAIGFVTIGPIWPALSSMNVAGQSRRLSVADRVGYQYAIEEIFWRHRIWPKDNPRPKPALDTVMSQRQVEQSVRAYLQNSQLLADQWHQPIAPAQLQAEMNRMADQSKQPEVLAELFDVLGNDPAVIAECLARPILAERLVREHWQDKSNSKALQTTKLEQPAVADIPVLANYTLPRVAGSSINCTPDSWSPTSAGPAGRQNHTAVWTGSEMIIWGGEVPDGTNTFLNSGARYTPSTDSWTATSVIDAPIARAAHTAIWTGSEMIVWGGYYDSHFTFQNSGGRYKPSTDSWAATSTTAAPAARAYHTAVWTGAEMIVWGGGNNSDENPFGDGGRYNPSTDSWVATSAVNSPSGRALHTAVWAGNQMIIWGGLGTNYTALNTGGRYDPSANSWITTNLQGAPEKRLRHSAVWTGSEMIVWGGANTGYIYEGGRYNPHTDSWSAITITNVPHPRTNQTVVWTGSEMIIWGGMIAGQNYDTGSRYNPSIDRWSATAQANAPGPRYGHTAVWADNEMIVWGGVGSANASVTGGRYCAPAALNLTNAKSRKGHGNAGNFDVELPVVGTPGIECRDGGATRDYQILLTFDSSVTVNGNPQQAAVTLGTGAVGTGGVMNGGAVTISGNVVTVPLTNVANAQTINVTLHDVAIAGDATSSDVTIPMSILIGDTNANGMVTSVDVSQVKSQSGASASQATFRQDLNTSGQVNTSDVSMVKTQSGTRLP